MELLTDTNELLEKIKVCVGYDLIGKGNTIRNYEDMSITEKVKFIKQSNRLYDACILMPDEQNYINERYNDIMKRKRKSIKL
jgi:hypothetical protein